MRVLQIIHDFLPRHQAGSELYCFHLSKQLQKTGCDVHLLFGEIDHQRSTGDFRHGEYEGLPFTEIVQNHDVRSITETYHDERTLKVICQEIDRIKPDIVHIHHLLGLGFQVPQIAQDAGARVVMTLHDYWLSCARGGGQRFRGPGKLCEDVDPGLCAQCLAGQHAGGSRILRKLSSVLKRFGSGNELDLYESLSRAAIKTPNKLFVGKTLFALDGIARKTILAHPPSRIEYALTIPSNAKLEGWIGMEPSTHEKSESGVIFTIEIDGQQLAEFYLHPRERKEDRGWHPIHLDLQSWAGKTVRLTLASSVPDSSKHDFCAAGWGSLEIYGDNQESPEAYKPSVWAHVRQWGENLLAGLFHQTYRKQAEIRIEASLKIPEAVDVFLAPSAFLCGRFEAYGYPQDKMLVSDYGIWTPPNAKRPPIGKKADRPLRFVFIGTLVEHKGAHVLLEAFRRLPHGAAVLDIYGNPDEFVDYTTRLRRLAKHPDISFRGRLENKDLMRILADADALIVPSIWFENSPITIHEAFLARIPVITSDLGGMAELVKDGKSGFLFPVGDATALYELLMGLIEDPSRLDEARPGPEMVKTIEHDTQWMLDLYKALLNGEFQIDTFRESAKIEARRAS